MRRKHIIDISKKNLLVVEKYYDESNLLIGFGKLQKVLKTKF